MARSRNIKPGFFSSEELGRCPIPARLLFSALWTLADRAGRLEDRPAKIKVYAFPYDAISVEEVDGWMADLAREKLIERYDIDGQKLVWIPKFTKHQNPHTKESQSVLPGKDGVSHGQEPGIHDTSAEKEPDKHRAISTSSRGKTRLIPDSLIPDSLIPDSGDSAPRTDFPPMPPLSEADPAYWVDKLIETHPSPTDPRFPFTFCQDNLHRLGDPERYAKFMREVFAGLERWCEYWAQSGNQYAKNLDTWLLGGGWKKSPPVTVAAAARPQRGPIDLKAEEE